MIAPEQGESIWCRRLPLILSLTYGAVGIFYIVASDQLLLMVLRDPEQLTATQTFKGWVFVILTAVMLYCLARYGVRRVRESEHLRRASAERFRRMIEISNEGVWMIDKEGRTSFVNETMAKLLGYTREEIDGRPLVEFVDPGCRRLVEDELAKRRCGERSQYECKFRRSSGEEIWTIVTSIPVLARDGGFRGAFKAVTDITKQKSAEDELVKSVADQRKLLNELDHRVRNNLSSVLGLLQLARTGSPETDALAEAVSGRVKAMSRAYSLLSASGWSGQDLARLIGTLAPGDARDRVHLRGEDVKVPAHQTGALAILLHELMENAVKHGALSSSDGSIVIAWKCTDEGAKRATAVRKLELEWIERDGPRIESEPEHGAGLRLVEGLAASDLRGRAQLSFPSSGARHGFEIELVGPVNGIQVRSEQSLEVKVSDQVRTGDHEEV